MSGQGVLETLVTVGLTMIFFLFGACILLRGLGTIILTKWAAEYAHCLALSQNEKTCVTEITRTLQNNFAFKNIQMNSNISEGIIHSEIQARLIGNTFLLAGYDLGPSEYKRVSR